MRQIPEGDDLYFVFSPSIAPVTPLIVGNSSTFFDYLCSVRAEAVIRPLQTGYRNVDSTFARNKTLVGRTAFHIDIQ